MILPRGSPSAQAERDPRRRREQRGWVVATVPWLVVAQAWRSARDVHIAMVLGGCREVAMDASASRRTGELCAAAKTADVVDAFVVRGAADRHDDVLTSDPGDLVVLAAHAPGVGKIRTLDELGE